MGIFRSFQHGNDGEQFVISTLQGFGLEAAKNTDKETKYDHDIEAKIDNKKFTIEVKHDVMAEKTKNLAIEIHNVKQDKPSGLNCTKANLWACIIPDGENRTLWITSVKKLKEFCNNTEPVKTIAAGGDKNAKLLLYKCDVILPQVFHRFETLKEDKAKKLIKELLK